MPGIDGLKIIKESKMNTIVESSWQSWIIALGLLIMIPVTIGLGMDFFAPKVDHQKYYKVRSEHFKMCRDGKDEQNSNYEKCDTDWQESETQKQYLLNMKNRSKFQIIVSSPLVLGLVVVSNFIISVTISAAFIVAGVMIHAFYENSGPLYKQEPLVMIWQFVLSFLSLLGLIWGAYRARLD